MKISILITCSFCVLWFTSLGFSQNSLKKYPFKNSFDKNQVAALIIHNHQYQQIRPTVAFASSIDTLKQQLLAKNVEVTYAKDLNKVALYNAIDGFAQKLKKKRYNAILVFYWGYRLEYRNQNYLLPVDFKAPIRKKDLLYGSISVNELLTAFRRIKVPHYFFINGQNQSGFQIGSTQIGRRDKLRATNTQVIYLQKNNSKAKPRANIRAYAKLFKQEPCLNKIVLGLEKMAKAVNDQIFKKGKVRQDICLEPAAAQVNVPQLQQQALQWILNIPDTTNFLKALKAIQQTLKVAPKNKTSLLIASALSPATYGLIPVKGGVFTMGHVLGEKDEKPIHRVRLSDFAMGRYEVTNLAYLVFLARYNTRSKRIAEVKNDEVYKKELLLGDHLLGLAYNVKKQLWEIKDSSYLFHPVVNVSWYGAMKYCAYYGLMLPTEAQWEYAARGASRNAFAGANKLSKVGWFLGNSEATERTRPVGLLTPNAWGLYDLSGNVYEWCYDTYEDDYYRVLASKRINVNPVNTKARKIMGIRTPSNPYPKVIRGGSYQSSYINCQVFSRDKELPYEISHPGDKKDYVRKMIGFRIVKLRAKN